MVVRLEVFGIKVEQIISPIAKSISALRKVVVGVSGDTRGLWDTLRGCLRIMVAGIIIILRKEVFRCVFLVLMEIIIVVTRMSPEKV